MMADPSSPLRLLSLDGGGVRGLSSIIILKHIMRGISKLEKRQVQPWEVFDLMGGTSTGGLIAVMLGRLHMTLDDCLEAYLSLSERIFNPRRSKINVAGKAKDYLRADGRFDSNELEIAIKEIIEENGHAETALFQEPDAVCKVFVCAVRTSNSGIALLRSYENDEEIELLYDECKIWEACRATSAATTFFEPITIGKFDQKFADGAVVYNNPIQQVYREAYDLWPERINTARILSIGTGSAPGGAFTGNIKDIVMAMKEIVTETENTANEFFRGHPEMVNDGLLYRFNVYHGLADIGLEEYYEKARIKDATDTYLTIGETQFSIKSCTRQFSYIPTPTLAVDRLNGDASNSSQTKSRNLLDSKASSQLRAGPGILVKDILREVPYDDESEGEYIGTASFTIVSANGYPSSDQIMVYVMKESNTKAIYTTKRICSPLGIVPFNETFAIKAIPDSKFILRVLATSNIGSEHELGENVFVVDENSSGLDRTLMVGNGSVLLRTKLVHRKDNSIRSPLN